eukprot:11170134-Lingulodinium_polyedra.AAC.1
MHKFWRRPAWDAARRAAVPGRHLPSLRRAVNNGLAVAGVAPPMAAPEAEAAGAAAADPQLPIPLLPREGGARA